MAEASEKKGRGVADAADTQSMNSPDELAKKEKTAAARIELGHYRFYLMGTFVVFVLSLFLPHAGSIKGYDVLFFTPASHEAGIKIAEYVFVFLGSISVVLLNGLLLLTKRTVFANFGFALTGMALLTSLLGLWMRMQSAEVDGAAGVSYGFYIEVAAVIVQVYALSCTVFARSDEQREWAAQRAAHVNLDEVALVQRERLTSRGANTNETNPLLIDNRRQQAAAKRKRTAGQDAHKPQQ